MRKSEQTQLFFTVYNPLKILPQLKIALIFSGTKGFESEQEACLFSHKGCKTAHFGHHKK